MVSSTGINEKTCYLAAIIGYGVKHRGLESAATVDAIVWHKDRGVNHYCFQVLVLTIIV